MARTNFLAEKDEATFLRVAGNYLPDGFVPESYRAFVLVLRDEGYAPTYAAYMVKKAQERLEQFKQDFLSRHSGDGVSE